MLSFLVLPIHQSFDPSLAFLAAGALPLSMFLYHLCRGPEKPRLGGAWAVPKGGQIDSKLIIGAALFGVGWGMAGICRMFTSCLHVVNYADAYGTHIAGPGLVNLGRALSGGSGLTEVANWLGGVVVGGLLV